MAHTTLSAPASAGLLARVAGLVDSLKARYAQYRTYRETLEELERLSDRELADLGLSRSIIRRVAYQGAYEMK